MSNKTLDKTIEIAHLSVCLGFKNNKYILFQRYQLQFSMDNPIAKIDKNFIKYI